MKTKMRTKLAKKNEKKMIDKRKCHASTLISREQKNSDG